MRYIYKSDMHEMTLENTRFYQYYQGKGVLNKESFLDLQPLYTFKKIPENTYLLRAGEKSQHIYFVEKGLLVSTTLNEKGSENVIHFASEDWFVAERNSLFDDQPSSVYIKTIEPSTIVYIDKEFPRKASEISESFGCFNDQMLQKNILVQERRIQSLLSMSAKERYLLFLKTYPNIPLRVPQWMIASYLGVTPESLSRIRKEIAYSE
ncbi:MAG TPA: Crp/Fnr family transcriptional regulator [Sphingobacterium sp.]|nr:Crp/Fnr family transcriptional regulator [Sphingobacterium sp.]